MQKKIIIAIILNVVVVIASLSYVSYVTVNKGIERSLQNRLALARIIASNVELVLNRNMKRLMDVAQSEYIDMSDGDPTPEKRILETIHKYSLFTEGTFLLDKHGNMRLSYPFRADTSLNMTHITYVNDVLQQGKPVISDVYTIEHTGKRVIFIMVPLRDREGRISGVVGGILSPTNDFLPRVLQDANIEKGAYAEIIDANEIVIASDNPSHVLQHHDHGGMMGRMIREGKSEIVECAHAFSQPDTAEKSPDLLAFVPLHSAPWGLIVGQSKQDIFAPSIALQREFIMLALVFALAATMLAVTMSRNIVAPLGSLIDAVNRISSGDLSTPVGNVGKDEILTLSKNFDDMRLRLAESLERIRTQNLELERRVELRTQEIRQSREKVEQLLQKIISSQEDERRRVARDLHDTILQDISAFLIQLDVCKLQPELITAGKIDEMRDIAVKAIDSIHAVIKDLRPTVLDDLGINAAIHWLLAKHLARRGINYYFDLESPLTRRLPHKIEITVFRILQEVLINIARHSRAQNVFVTVDADDANLEITIEDDGEGFDVHDMLSLPSDNGRGLGIMGMKERAMLIGGKMRIYSSPGEGTKVCLRVPVAAQVDHV